MGLLTVSLMATGAAAQPTQITETISAALSDGSGAGIAVTDVRKTEAEGLLVTLDNGLRCMPPSRDHFVVGDLYAIRDGRSISPKKA